MLQLLRYLKRDGYQVVLRVQCTHFDRLTSNEAPCKAFSTPLRKEGMAVLEAMRERKTGEEDFSPVQLSFGCREITCI